MQLKQLDLPGGGLLTVYLRDCVETMPLAMERPLVLVVPGGGYSHVSAREGDPVALQFAAAGYHTAVLRRLRAGQEHRRLLAERLCPRHCRDAGRAG